jgi:hypothetical protein
MNCLEENYQIETLLTYGSYDVSLFVHNLIPDCNQHGVVLMTATAFLAVSPGRRTVQYIH